jgi:hypothetical protein
MIYRGREPAGGFGDAEAGVDEDGESLRGYEGKLTTNYVPTLDYVQYLIDGHLVDPDTVEPVGMWMIDEGFRAAYRELEGRMKKRAEDDGDVFLPNPEPLGPVEYAFVCMEPSLGRWARSPDEARSKVEVGFRNFTSSIEDFILHFSIRHYLCAPGQRYHITDLSKGAMFIERAGIDRTRRYDRWYGLLVEELDLVAVPGSRVFAVGGQVAHHLERRAFPRSFTKVIHYSGVAARARGAGIVGHEDRGVQGLSLSRAPARDGGRRTDGVRYTGEVPGPNACATGDVSAIGVPAATHLQLQARFRGGRSVSRTPGRARGGGPLE